MFECFLTLFKHHTLKQINRIAIYCIKITMLSQNFETFQEHKNDGLYINGTHLKAKMQKHVNE